MGTPDIPQRFDIFVVHEDHVVRIMLARYLGSSGWNVLAEDGSPLDVTTRMTIGQMTRLLIVSDVTLQTADAEVIGALQAYRDPAAGSLKIILIHSGAATQMS